MSDFDALLCAIVGQPREDTPKLALVDYLMERGLNDLAEIVVLKTRLLEYRPHLGMSKCPNQSQAACDIRDRLKQLEEDILEDETDAEHKAIEETFFLVAYLRRPNQLNAISRAWKPTHGTETAILMREMLSHERKPYWGHDGCGRIQRQKIFSKGWNPPQDKEVKDAFAGHVFPVSSD